MSEHQHVTELPSSSQTSNPLPDSKRPWRLLSAARGLLAFALVSLFVLWLVSLPEYFARITTLTVETYSQAGEAIWDIDVIIRKTLVYGVLTALLALVYFGGVVLLQRLVGTLTGAAQSPLAVVVSTLAIFILFAPLRGRIQDVIDRRFFRKKYDSQQVLAQFAQTARDETDLDALTTELARVVQETLQPEGVSVWLKESAPVQGRR